MHRATFALGLVLFGVGISLFTVGGTGVYTLWFLRGSLRGARALVLPVVVGLVLAVLGSLVVAFELGGKKESRTPQP